MKQNKQYLYEYLNGKRIRNLGFMKIEESMNKSVVHLYANEIDDVVGIVFRRRNGEKYMAGWEENLLVKEEPIMDKIDGDAKIEWQDEVQMEIEEYITPRNTTYQKIRRQDLSRLPRKEWRIANNSFLLHGYYNYNHLLYIEEDGETWIGVPGIFHENEQEAARSFGFSAFRRLVNNEIELEENEKNTYEDFGYWCRQIPRT